MTQALVSLILCVKNGMPYVTDAVESVRAQTYRRFELVVQDAGSTDGTLEHLRGVDDLPALEIVSEPDGGIGDAYNRALRRCRGEIVGSIDSDNLLEPDALEAAVSFLQERPGLAAFYGGVNTIDADGSLLRPWMPDDFELLRLLACELVPPFSVAFFSRAVCGVELRVDESLRTCADYDLWLRLSHLPIGRFSRVLGSTRLSSSSMSRDPQAYDQFVADKIAALDRFLARQPQGPLSEAVERRSRAGIFLWAAESLYDVEGGWSDRVERYASLGEELDPSSPRLAALRALAHAAEERTQAAAAEASAVESPPPPPPTGIRGWVRARGGRR